MTQRFKSEAMEAVHQSAQALFRIGAIDKATLRDFDAAALPHRPRLSLNKSVLCASNAKSAKVYLQNCSISALRPYKNGKVVPSGLALKMLDVVSKHGTDVLAH